MNVVLLAGARNNCGDYLIVDRAQRLFDHFLPSARRVTLDRTHLFGEADIRTMAAADLVVRMAAVREIAKTLRPMATRRWGASSPVVRLLVWCLKPEACAR